ncbi:uncharacterized protein MKZ38_004427 [Zalerion maritima]|uniref:Uncharacterized protein n=1 Tax=Zalerion maritima TaxID=339359 RepID=A0AAD5RWK0_9PEZI|nr:uncharacterized protein MKZ38_004427 [Zalerion maritima]
MDDYATDCYGNPIRAPDGPFNLLMPAGRITLAPDPLPEDCFVRPPYQFNQVMEDGAVPIRSNLGTELELWELLRKYPGPQFMEYQGAVMKDGKVVGLCFKKFKEYLHDSLSRPENDWDYGSVLTLLGKPVEHMQELGFAVNVVGPKKVMVTDSDSGSIPRLAFLDFCQPPGISIHRNQEDAPFTSSYRNDEISLRLMRIYLGRMEEKRKPGETRHEEPINISGRIPRLEENTHKSANKAVFKRL